MIWKKLVDKTYNETGLKAPVFFAPKMNRTRVFVDVDQGKVQLEYSYEPVQAFNKNRNDIQWQKLESGLIENDFAFEMLGINALRLRVIDAGKRGARVHVFQTETGGNNAR